ncbi:MAG: AbrB/MazE/SpoVT family DNA-binding domain-containing protein [Proteobacteria bacterium]|nr:AbrB/MazE/SpoVT family DNA-binding domain-containing protein [Pseudomonadota bacterium]
MKITSKGQVTIPQELREQLGFLPGSEVRFIPEGNTLRVVKEPPPGGRGRDLVKRLRGKATVAMTTDEILALTRGE